MSCAQGKDKKQGKPEKFSADALSSAENQPEERRKKKREKEKDKAFFGFVLFYCPGKTDALR